MSDTISIDLFKDALASVLEQSQLASSAMLEEHRAAMKQLLEENKRLSEEADEAREKVRQAETAGLLFGKRTAPTQSPIEDNASKRIQQKLAAYETIQEANKDIPSQNKMGWKIANVYAKNSWNIVLWEK